MPAPAPNVPPDAFGGEPGSAYTNTTGKILYQYHCQFSNSCGRCAQYDGMIGPWWPIPLHGRCNCTQEPVPPGYTARPFTDFRDEINKLPPGQQGRLVGRGNLQLIESGKVQWEDVVTRGRVRTLGEVVQRGKLTRDDLIGAGLSGPRADAALGTTRAAAPADAAKRAAIEKLRSLGLTDAEIKQAVKDRLRARVGIGKGPSGGSPPPTPRPPGTPTAPPASSDLRTMVEGKFGVPPALVKQREKIAFDFRATLARQAMMIEGVSGEIPPEIASKVYALQNKIDALAKKLEGADAAIAGAKRPALDIIADYVRTRQSPAAASVKEHGMTVAESLHSVEWDGLTWKGPAVGGDPENVIVRSIYSMLDPATSHGPIPAEIAKHTREVIFSTQRNNADDYWASAYNTPGLKSHATGGDGNIVVYNGATIDPGSLAHEMGHNLATAKYGGTQPTPLSDFVAAGRDRPFGVGPGTVRELPPTDYARNSKGEDFAESTRLYYADPERLKRLAPLRFDVIDRLAKDPNYGG